ncbi:MAG TPA: aldehyde dehydrogenase family protein, partial [Gemmatimonadaceae bacterium]|nr:aldehyde dehydrogenase family protein [Gemmatimonadaceae bacterium]
MTTVAQIFESMEYGPAPEADAPALEWIRRHGSAESGELGQFIGGGWTRAGETFEVINPATGKPLARVSQGTAADVDAAVAAARAALPAWRALSGHARAR